MTCTAGSRVFSFSSNYHGEHNQHTSSGRDIQAMCVVPWPFFFKVASQTAGIDICSMYIALICSLSFRLSARILRSGCCGRCNPPSPTFPMAYGISYYAISHRHLGHYWSFTDTSAWCYLLSTSNSASVNLPKATALAYKFMRRSNPL